jgi:hypothetical protein
VEVVQCCHPLPQVRDGRVLRGQRLHHVWMPAGRAVSSTRSPSTSIHVVPAGAAAIPGPLLPGNPQVPLGIKPSHVSLLPQQMQWAALAVINDQARRLISASLAHR